jgi:ankyrin repeat protein
MNHPSIQWRILLLTLSLCMVQASIAAADAKLDKELLVQCGYGNVDQVADLLKQGASPNATNEHGVSALHLTARDGHVKLIKLLIDHGAKVNVKDRSGGTPLQDAAGSDSTEAVELLLNSGAKPDSSALAQACWLGRTDTVLLLMIAGVRPDEGLASAAQGGHVELVRLLLAKGVNVNHKADSGVTALHMAALQGGLKTVRLLLEKGADPNVTDKDNETPLHMAISGDGDFDIIKLLVESGAELNIANKEGITPVRLASIHGAKEAYNFLLAASGGKEPAVAAQAGSKSTKQLIAELDSDKRETRIAAQRMLVGRGEVVMPEVLKAIEVGAKVERFYEFFQAMGPRASTALPMLESQLADKEYVWIAGVTIECIKPGGLVQLSDAAKQAASESLYEALIDPKIDVAIGVHARMLIALGDPAVPTILRLLRHERPELRAFIARQLVHADFQNDALRAELLKLQTEDPVQEVRANASRGLANPKFHSSRAKSALIEQLRTAPIVLIYSPDQPQTEREADGARKRAVDDLLDDTAHALASYGPDIIDELLPIVRNENDLASKQVPNVWSKLGSDTVPKFESLLDDSDPRIRHAAYRQIGRLASDSPAALKTLHDRLTSDDAADRQFAAQAVIDNRLVSKELRPAMLTRLSDEQIEPRTRLGLVTSALRADPKSTKSADEIRQFLPRIIEVATSGEYLDRCIALEVLGSLGATAKEELPQLKTITKEQLPPLPAGPRPRVGEKMTEEWRKAVNAQHQTQMIRQLAKESIEQIEKDIPLE